METEQKQNDKRGGNEMGAIVNVEGTVTVKEKDMVNIIAQRGMKKKHFPYI